MNSKKKVGGKLARRMFVRFVATMIIFSIALVAALYGGMILCSMLTWPPTSFLYQMLKLIDFHQVEFLILCWLFGFVVILFFYWKKSFDYIDTIAQAGNKLITEDEEFIHLPADLKPVEDIMNQAKLNAVRGSRLAKEAEQRKNDLIVYLAHDLKTPLTSVIGYLTLLRDEQAISPALREKYTAISLDRAERLEDLINEFFEITRFNLSHLTLEYSMVNLTRMLEQIAFEFKPVLSEKNLEINLQLDSDMEINCDVDKMERVFDNLIRNAVSYSYENTAIEIGAGQRPDGVYLRFLNRGKTIPQEKLGRIFEQFYRLDESRGTKSGGAGLGLAIAKEIIDLHGGTINVQSKDETVEFSLFLPTVRKL